MHKYTISVLKRIGFTVEIVFLNLYLGQFVTEYNCVNICSVGFNVGSHCKI